MVHGLEVHCTKEMPALVRENNIEIGIITTPAQRAQRACKHLVNAGITSILNFAPSRVKAPENVDVEYVDFFHHLYSLAFNHNAHRG